MLFLIFILSHNLYVHELAEHLKILYIVAVNDDDVLPWNRLLVVLHVHAGLKKD